MATHGVRFREPSQCPSLGHDLDRFVKLKFRGKIRDKSLFYLRLAGFGVAVHWERSD